MERKKKKKKERAFTKAKHLMVSSKVPDGFPDLSKRLIAFLFEKTLPSSKSDNVRTNIFRIFLDQIKKFKSWYRGQVSENKCQICLFCDNNKKEHKLKVVRNFHKYIYW